MTKRGPYTTYASSDPYGFTLQQRVVAEFLCAGLSLVAIAARTGMTYESVRGAASRCYRKVGVRNQVQLIAKLGELAPAAAQAPPAALADTLPAPGTPTPLDRALTAARELVKALEEARLEQQELDRVAFEADPRSYLQSIDAPFVG